MILCIDRIPAFLHIFRTCFERGGDEVLTASTEKEGLELITKKRVDAVVLDYEMLGRSDAAVLQIVKRVPVGAPIVVLTEQIDSIPQNVRNATTVVLTKGMFISELLRCVERTLKAKIEISLGRGAA
jgi:CheY-like chemotaxis protein